MPKRPQHWAKYVKISIGMSKSWGSTDFEPWPSQLNPRICSGCLRSKESPVSPNPQLMHGPQSNKNILFDSRIKHPRRFNDIISFQALSCGIACNILQSTNPDEMSLTGMVMFLFLRKPSANRTPRYVPSKQRAISVTHR